MIDNVGMVDNVVPEMDNIANSLDNTANVVDNLPNPNGKLGSPEHQAVINELSQSTENQKYFNDIFEDNVYFKNEVHITTTGGTKGSRYADVGIFNSSDDLVGVCQVGVMNLNNTPVSREVKAINDIW